MSFWRDARFLQAGTRQRATSEDAMSGDAQYLWVSRYAQEARVPGIEHSDICDMLDKFGNFAYLIYLGFLLFPSFNWIDCITEVLGKSSNVLGMNNLKWRSLAIECSTALQSCEHWQQNQEAIVAAFAFGQLDRPVQLKMAVSEWPVIRGLQQAARAQTSRGQLANQIAEARNQKLQLDNQIAQLQEEQQDSQIALGLEGDLTAASHSEWYMSVKAIGCACIVY